MELAHPSDTDLDDPDKYVAELKYDGTRIVATTDSEGNATLTNRRNVDKTKQYPNLVKTLDLPPNTVVDGEVIVPTDNRPTGDFSKLLQRDKCDNPFKISLMAKHQPAQFVAFDICEIEGRDIRNESYEIRRNELEGIIEDTETFTSVASKYEDITNAQRRVSENNLEGLVAKRKDSPYPDGRTDDWIKLKNIKDATIYALSYEEHDKGITVESEDGHRVTVNGRAAKSVKKAIESGRSAIEISYLFKRNGSFIEPRFKRIQGDS